MPHKAARLKQKTSQLYVQSNKSLHTQSSQILRTMYAAYTQSGVTPTRKVARSHLKAAKPSIGWLSVALRPQKP